MMGWVPWRGSKFQCYRGPHSQVFRHYQACSGISLVQRFVWMCVAIHVTHEAINLVQQLWPYLVLNSVFTLSPVCGQMCPFSSFNSAVISTLSSEWVLTYHTENVLLCASTELLSYEKCTMFDDTFWITISQMEIGHIWPQMSRYVPLIYMCCWNNCSVGDICHNSYHTHL